MICVLLDKDNDYDLRFVRLYKYLVIAHYIPIEQSNNRRKKKMMVIPALLHRPNLVNIHLSAIK